jgi:uncharacterized protein YbjT (DUF2867 family)
MPSIVLLAGASGVVGGSAIRHLLASSEVQRVIAVGRRPLPVQHEKLVSEVVNLQSDGDTRAKLPDGIDIAISALGTTINQAGSQPAFRAIDHDAVLTFAAAALAKGAQRFLLVSSVGANAKSKNFYLRTKGETEADLAKLGFANLTILRPSMIDDQGTRPDHRLTERVALPIFRAAFSVIGKQSRYAPITADALGRALMHSAFDLTTERVRILEGKTLHFVR